MARFKQPPAPESLPAQLFPLPADPQDRSPGGRVAVVAPQTAHWADLLRLTGTFECVCACSSLEEALAAFPGAKPDIVLVDFDVAGEPSQPMTALKELLPSIPFVAVGSRIDSEAVLEAFRCGAVGFLEQTSPPSRLTEALLETCRGGAPMPRHIARCLVESLYHPRSIVFGERWHLSHREQEVLGLLSDGLCNREMAGRLQITVETVRAHLKHIFEKLDVRSRAEAVSKYLRA